jgi:hypothetical protein
MTRERVRANVEKLSHTLRGCPARPTLRRARELLDETHEGLIAIMVREAHAASCLSRALRRLDARRLRAAISALRSAASDLGE